jgi:hypothetical protein
MIKISHPNMTHWDYNATFDKVAIFLNVKYYYLFIYLITKTRVHSSNVVSNMNYNQIHYIKVFGIQFQINV